MNLITKLGKIRPCDLNQFSVPWNTYLYKYVYTLINAVANSVMLELLYMTYNIVFKIKHKLHIASGSAPPPPTQ